MEKTKGYIRINVERNGVKAVDLVTPNIRKTDGLLQLYAQIKPDIARIDAKLKQTKE